MNFNKEKLQEIYLKLPIKYKISIIVILILTISLLLLSSLLFENEKEILVEEMQKRGRVILHNLVQAGWEAIINDNRAVTGDVISELMQNREKYNILYCIVLDKKNRVFDHSNPDEIGKIYDDEYSQQLKDITEVVSTERIYEGKEIIDMSAPIFIVTKTKKVKIGTARIGISKEVLQKAVRGARLRTIILTFIFIIAGIIISFLFAETITSPIRKIVSVMEKVGQGDLHQKVVIGLKDEIGKLASSFNEMIRHLREKLLMQKFVSKSTVEMISQKEDTTLELGGKRKKVTMFFSDIRGFTSYSETRAPENVISMLNSYLSFQADIIHKYNGAVDKFVGDEVMAIFEGKNMVEDAIKTAIEIQQRVKKENKNRDEDIHIGIGIHTGEVVMGNMGSKDRMDYTVIGDNVNVAARLCDVAKPDQILVTESTLGSVKDKFQLGKKYKINVKGKSEPLIVYEIVY